MHKFFTPRENFSENECTILGDDVKHIYKVLRLAEGEKVILNNCNGEEFLGAIKSVGKQEVVVSILEKLDIDNESEVKIYLFQGLPKSQKMDLIVQKGTELGICEFIPTLTSRVDIKLKGDFKKLDRLNRIALEAAKQSKRSIVPRVTEPVSFESAISEIKLMDLMIVPYENAENFGVKTLMEELKNTDKKGISTKRKIGKTTYEVVVHFNENARETMQDKLTRIMLRELRRKSDEKKDDFD